jgi:hypothetical protein
VVAESRIADAEVPDGGYGWVVIAACSVLCFWFVGTSYSWGVIQAALVKENVSTPASLSFVGSLTAACISFLALANARLIRKIGGRNTALAGVVFLGDGRYFEQLHDEERWRVVLHDWGTDGNGL